MQSFPLCFQNDLEIQQHHARVAMPQHGVAHRWLRWERCLGTACRSALHAHRSLLRRHLHHKEARPTHSSDRMNNSKRTLHSWLNADR